MISKELLSEVLGEKRVILDYEVSIDETEIHYGHKDIDEDGFINIYELAHKCKEWASKQHYSVISGWEMNHCGGSYHVEVFRNSNNILFSMSTINTEPEAIFKASEWILNNKGE